VGAPTTAQMRELSQQLGREAGPGVGFAVFVGGSESEWSYASNGQRLDVVRALGEWLTRLDGRLPVRESVEERDARFGLETLCARLGRSIDQRGLRVVLFLFDFGSEGGHLAFFTNEPKRARSGVATWIEQERRRN
jgi:hypothetical protein